MADSQRSKWRRAGAFLTSLGRDTRANALALVAMALIPLAGMVGGGVDISRMYIVKTRLQHACDAGALAGRKAMGGGTWAQNNYMPRTSAEKFFDANYNRDAYGASGVQRSFAEDAGKVTGAASAVLPMTLMRIFGRTTETLSVTCSAEMRLPNTDVMFVLDVTGSMGSKAVSSDSETKIVALRNAVKCFYEIVARLDTDAVCATGNPSGGTGNQVQIRFGFVPYSANVNVGKLLPTSFFADNWSYQSREPEWTAGGTTWEQTGAAEQISSESMAVQTYQQYCNNTTAKTLDPAPTEQVNGSEKWVTEVNHYADSYSNGTCYGRKVTTRTHYVAKTGQTFQRWHYGLIRHNIAGLKNGSSWNGSVDLPIGPNGTMQSVSWPGCIEERTTVRATNYDPIPSGARDLDIDLMPNAGNPDTLWGPALPGAIFTRNATSSNRGNTSGWSLPDAYTTTDYYNNSVHDCPAEGRKLQSWNDASTFSSYVNSLQPVGNTYHDIGLLWGARLMSPSGIFKSENEYTPQGGEIERHLIFMTDGEACTENHNYNAYGVAWFDRRQTNASSVPTDGCNTTGTLTQQVNARTQALCKAVKNKNITLWVIWFGASNTTIETMLETCASSGRFFTARDSAQLQTTFKSIADQISQLRLTK